MVFYICGGVPEWLNGAVLKTAVPLVRYRGFESHPLRRLDTKWSWLVGCGRH